MKTHVLLDGGRVDPDKIDPAKHRFLGVFRPPVNPTEGCRADAFVCPCGHHLFTVEAGQQHYRAGHFDVPQYQTIGT